MFRGNFVTQTEFVSANRLDVNYPTTEPHEMRRTSFIFSVTFTTGIPAATCFLLCAFFSGVRVNEIKMFDIFLPEFVLLWGQSSSPTLPWKVRNVKNWKFMFSVLKHLFLYNFISDIVHRATYVLAAKTKSLYLLIISRNYAPLSIAKQVITLYATEW